jgi:cobalt-zinc-cadmium efflux system protein
MAHNHAHDHDHHHTHDTHDHSHAAGHGHSHAPTSFNTAFAVSTLLNFAFVIIEAVYAVLANSMSLLADAGHNLADVLGLLMAWGASWLLKREASEKYSYGYKKTTILSALANALLLVATSAIIVYESINKLIHPVAINEWTVIIVAFIGILINGSTALMFMRGSEHDLNIKGAYLHLAYDALISVGVVIAGAIVLWTKWLWVDPIVGIVIVVVIVAGTWGLLRHSVDLILGAVPHGINLTGVRNYLEKIDGVTAVHDLHIWGLSTQETALTVHLVMPERVLSDADYVEINHILHHDFKIQHATIQVEKGEADSQCRLMDTC